MAAQTYEKCVCGHKDVLHHVDKPHACRSIKCTCEGFITQKTLDKLNEEIDKAS
jgi:hypothetical protein